MPSLIGSAASTETLSVPPRHEATRCDVLGLVKKLGGAVIVSACLLASACTSSAGSSTINGNASAAAPSPLSEAQPAVTAPAPASAAPEKKPHEPAVHIESPTPEAPRADPCEDPSASATGLAPIAHNRYAEICLGMSFAEATKAMPGPIIAGRVECPWYATVLEAPDAGLYVSAVTRPEEPGEEIILFTMTWSGSLANAAVFPAPETAEGISVGSTTDEVAAAYPKAKAVVVDDPALGTRHQVVVPGTDDTAIVFDVTEGRVSAVHWGTGLANGSIAEYCAL